MFYRTHPVVCETAEPWEVQTNLARHHARINNMKPTVKTRGRLAGKLEEQLRLTRGLLTPRISRASARRLLLSARKRQLSCQYNPACTPWDRKRERDHGHNPHSHDPHVHGTFLAPFHCSSVARR